MADEAEQEVPEGAAVFPVIPAELGINPLFLAVLHGLVFLAGSGEEVVHPAAADEALGQMADYLQRLAGPPRARLREDLACLARYAHEEKWPRQVVGSLKTLLDDLGLGGEEEAD